MTLKEFMKKADSEVLKEAAKCGTKEELKGFFVSRDVTVTDDEAEKLYVMLSKAKVRELSDEELDGIAGGGLFSMIRDCPNGHIKYVYYAFESKGYVDDRCLECTHYASEEGEWGTSRRCSKIDKQSYWEGQWWEW
ncbi:MAG: hypothetical protein ACOX4L_03795 [Bacillota bacterium]|jgi:hypothetical protein